MNILTAIIFFLFCVFSALLSLITVVPDILWDKARRMIEDRKYRYKEELVISISIANEKCPKCGYDGASIETDHFENRKKVFRTHRFTCKYCGYESKVYRTNLPPKNYISAKK